MPCHSIDKRAREIACTGMYHHAGLLVDNHESVVFIDDIKRNIFCNDTCVVLRTVEHQRDNISRAYLVVALYGLIIHVNEARIGCLLDAVTALIRVLLGQKLVNAHGSLPHVHLNFPVFKELLFIRFEVFYVVIQHFCHINSFQ